MIVPPSARKTAGISLLLLVLALSSCVGRAGTPQTTPSPLARVTGTSAVTDTAEAAPVVFLGDLSPVRASVGFGSLGVGFYNTPDDLGHNGHPIQSRGIAYAHGLMAHAPSEIEYRLDGQFRLFTTRMLAQDDLSCGDGVVFHVYLDNLEAYVSPVIRYDDEPEAIVLDVGGASLLTMVVDPRRSADCDWAIWGDPLLTPTADVAEGYPTPTLRTPPTPGPEAPCGPDSPEAVFVFLDCNDVRRIRNEIYGNPATSREWRILLRGVNDFEADFPRTYSPDDDAAWMWLDFMPRNMGLVYLISGDPSIGDEIGDLLRTVVEGTPPRAYEAGRPESGLVVQPGHFTSSHVSLLFAYATVRNTARFTDEDRATFDDYFLEQAERLDGFSAWVDSLRQDIWNTYIQADAAIASIALTLPDDTRSRSLYDRARQRLELRIARWYDADGGWREYADNYSPLVLQAILLWAETEFHTGSDLYSHSFGGTTFHAVCEWYLQVMTPQGVLPAIGDGHWLQSLDPGLLRLCGIRTADPSLEFAFEAYLAGRDLFPSRSYRLTYLFDTIAWSDTSLSGREPDTSSVLLPDSGLAVLRSSWGQDAQYLLLEFTDDLLPMPMHLHQSFGNIVLYDGGSWILENGYRGRTEEEYWRAVSTADHSTLTLDDSTQTNTRASSSYLAAPGTVGMASATSQTYSTLAHTRTVVWSESWHQWVVVDDAALSPPSPGHTLQLRWFVSLPDPQHPLSVDHTEEPEAANWTFTRAWGIPGTLSIDLFPGVPAAFSSTSRIYLDPWEGRATGVEMEVSPPYWPIRMVSVLTSTLEGSAPSSTTVRSDTPEATRVSSQREDRQWDWVLPRGPSTEAHIDAFLVSGYAGCRESLGADTTSYCLLGGTRLTYAGVTLVDSPSPVSVNADTADNLVYIDSPGNLTVALFWASDVARVTDELGDPVGFSISGTELALDAEQGSHVYSIHSAPE